MNKFIERIKKHYRKKLVAYLRDVLGINTMEENVFTLFDIATDITKCKPATGVPRELQNADTELLKTFDLLCKKYNLTYWLDFGTLLGAERHGGFIPWDDDLDVCMPREDYERAAEIFADILPKMGIETSAKNVKNQVWISMDLGAAGVHLDIFPLDSVYVDKNLSAVEIKNIVNDLRAGNITAEEINQRCRTDDKIKIYHYPNGVDNVFFFEDTIFPLQEHIFENYIFTVPANIVAYLTAEYGDYMKYPRSRVTAHKILIEYSQINGVDLNDVTEKLTATRQKLEKELTD